MIHGSMTALLASAFRVDPVDMVLVTGPVAIAMILVEIVSYWRVGRRPTRPAARAPIALAVGGPGIVVAILWMNRWHAAPLVIIGAMLLLWVMHSYHRTTAPIGRLLRAALVAMRMVIIVLLLAFMFNPTLYSIEHKTINSALVVLYDTSKSMGIADAGGDGKARRIEAVRGAVGKVSEKLKSLHGYDLEQFSFDDRGGDQWVTPVQDPAEALKAPLTLDTTAIGKSIDSACREVGAQRIAGVIVFTDGADNAAAGETLKIVEDLAHRRVPVPVWPVAVGSDKPPTDRPVAAIKEMSLSDHKLPVFDVLAVHAVYELINLPNRPVRVELVFGQGDNAKVADSQVITAAEGKSSDLISLDLKVTPTTAGFHAVTVRVADDAAAEDGTKLAGPFAQRTDYVQVDDDKLNVLYVEGKHRDEAKFIIQALGGSDLLRLNRQFILTNAALDAGANTSWPKDEAEWKKYHVIILGDVKASVFSAAELKTIAAMVQDYGKGLMMIGGRDAFGQGGWPDTPVAKLMPFDLHQAAGQIAQPFKLEATPQGLAHPLMQLDDKPEANAKAWAEIPPIEGANRFPDSATIVRENPGAMVLARTPADQPIIVAGQSGKGRVLAMAMDTTWRWRFHLDVDKGVKWHNHFWRQAVTWLANRDAAIWVRCDQPRYRLIERRTPQGGIERVVRDKISVTACIVDRNGKPVGADAKPKLKLFRPGAATKPDSDPPDPADVIDMASHFRGDLFQIDLPRPPTQGGEHTLVFEGEVDGRPVRAEAHFLVETIDLELAPPGLANYEFLRQLASITKSAGGQFYTINELDKLLERFKSAEYLDTYDVENTRDLGKESRWWLLAALVVLLLAEWIIRKRSSLV